VRLASRAFLPLNRQRETESAYNLLSHSKADDRVGKLIDIAANSQSGRVAEMPLSTGRVG
jgi:hypothetical protein